MRNAPRLVQQHAVGLQGVADLLARRNVLPLQLDDTAEEIQPHQGRLAPLEGELDRLDVFRLRRDVLPDIGLQSRVRHPPRFMLRVDCLLREVEAVAAIEVAEGADRLDQHVQAALARGEGRR